ncbi:hypothetical protein [Mycoplasmopsis sturni]|uniref:hypothetical protein n=1 Tax=Mycoplasmopsis sturni TaxID=39047 RepID=UPI0005631BE6|nr:hypothetical protein [Mycoplasmopsis sturni]
MKIVKEYLDFNTFKAKSDTTILPMIQEKINEIFESESIKKLKTYIHSAIPLTIVTILLAISFLVSLFSSFQENVVNSGQTKLVLGIAITLGVVAFILGAISFHLWSKYIKTKKAIAEKISSDLKSDKIYQKAFFNINPEFEYFEPNNSRFQEELDRNLSGEITQEDILMLKPKNVNSTLIESKVKAHLLISDKYPAQYLYTRWQVWIDDKKSKFVDTGLLKVNTSALKDKNFNWSLAFGKSRSNSKNGFKLENHQLAKKLQVEGDNPYRLAEMFTPYAQELIEKRMEDNQNSWVKFFKLYSNKDKEAIYFTFLSKWSFMDITASFSRNKETLAKRYYHDLLFDVYTYYYLLCYVYIPLYLY